MDLVRSITLLLAFLCVTIAVVHRDNNDVIWYLRRIERRITRLESVLVRKELSDNPGSNYFDGNGKQDGGQAYYENTNRRSKRATPLPGGNPLPFHDKLSQIGMNVQCLDKKVEQVADRYEDVSRKLERASDILLALLKRNHMKHLQSEIDDIKESFSSLMADIDNSDVNLPGYMSMNTVNGTEWIRLSCKKKKSMSEDLEMECKNIMLKGGVVDDIMKCCESKVISLPVISVSKREQTLLVGDIVSLQCMVNGETFPPVEISWDKESGGMPVSYKIDGGELKMTLMKKGDFGKYICKATNAAGTTTLDVVLKIPDELTCQPIESPMCKDLNYSHTLSNTKYGSPAEAAMEVHQFFPLVKVKCSKDLKYLLCSLYTPMCVENDQTIHPCRTLCERARSGCVRLMETFGFNWPANLNCEDSSDTEVLCLNRNIEPDHWPSNKGAWNDHHARIDDKPSIVPKDVQCERIRTDRCLNVGYSYTFMPNLLNQISQEEVDKSINDLAPILELDCSPDLLFLVCNVYNPVCAAGTYLPVCRSVCERVWRSCEKHVINLGLVWPASLNCQRLPVQSETAFCLDRGIAKTP